MNDWHEVCITDKTGKKYFKCTASPMSTYSEIKNLKRHIKQSKANPDAYSFLDVDSMVILLDGDVYNDPVQKIDADNLYNLLEELGL